MKEILNNLDNLNGIRSYAVKAKGDEEAVLHLALPGVEKQFVNIKSVGKILTVNLLNGADCTLLNRTKFNFTHNISAPKISAQMKNGMLTIRLLASEAEAEIAID